MAEIEIPILKKSYELYKVFHEYRRLVPKQDRFTIYERAENTILDIIELLLEATYGNKNNKAVVLQTAGVKLNVLRFFIRLMKESQIFDAKKYVVLQELIDEIGRMLGGWTRSLDK